MNIRTRNYEGENRKSREQKWFSVPFQSLFEPKHIGKQLHNWQASTQCHPGNVLTVTKIKLCEFAVYLGCNFTVTSSVPSAYCASEHS